MTPWDRHQDPFWAPQPKPHRSLDPSRSYRQKEDDDTPTADIHVLDYMPSRPETPGSRQNGAEGLLEQIGSDPPNCRCRSGAVLTHCIMYPSA